MMNLQWFDFVGFAGVMLVLDCLSGCRPKPGGNGMMYSLLNALGAAGILVPVVYADQMNYSVLFIELAWIAISVYGMWHSHRSREPIDQAASPEPRIGSGLAGFELGQPLVVGAFVDAFEQEGAEVALAGVRHHRQHHAAGLRRVLATSSAAAKVPPPEMPQKMPSCVASSRAVSRATARRRPARSGRRCRG